MRKFDRAFGKSEEHIYITGSSIIDELLLQYGLCFKNDSVWISQKNVWGELIKQSTQKLFDYSDISEVTYKPRFRRYEVYFNLKNSDSVVVTFQYGFMNSKKKKASIDDIFKRLQKYTKKD